MHLVLIALIFCFSTFAYADEDLPLPGGSSFSNLAVGELDGNSANGLEVVAATSSGHVRAFRNDGQLLWEAVTPNAKCDSSSNRVHSSAALGDLNRDGIQDVIIGYGGVGRERCDGGVIAFNGLTGKTLWRFSLKAWSKKERFGTMSYSVFSTPAVADTDGDGKLEIAFGSFDRNLYLLNSDGSVRWYYNAADTIWSSPAFADINGDGKLELIASTDISGNSRLRPVTKDGGYLYAFKTAARPAKKKRIYFRDKSAYYWQAALDQVPYSSPVVADVIQGNPGNEVVIASGCFFPQNSRNKRGKWIKIFSARNGKLLKTLPTQSCSSGSVAVGRLLGPASKAVVHIAPGNSSNDGQSRVTAYNPETRQTLWSVVPKSNGSNKGDAGSFQTPIIADIDGNGSQEVLVAHGKSVLIYEGASGNLLSCKSDNCNAGELSVGGDVSRASPTVADLNGDGIKEVLVNLSSGSSGRIRIWSGLDQIFSSTSALGESGAADFPSWRGGSQRTGVAR